VRFHKRTCLLILALASNASYATDNLYRADQPPVLNASANQTLQKAQSEENIIKDFKSQYQRIENPKFLMFWHRDFSDNINSNQEISASVTSAGTLPRNNYTQVLKLQWKNGSERSFSWLSSAASAEFEVGFSQVLRSGGMSLVDRNTAIRMTALDKTNKGISEENQNFQTIEASALAKFAKYFIEVNFIPDSESKNGTEPRVTVINSTTGEIIADVVPSDLYKKDTGKTSFIATNNGFVATTENPPSGEWKADDKGFIKKANKRDLKEEGRQVGYVVMKSLSESWSNVSSH
jgi:hypothetical protein